MWRATGFAGWALSVEGSSRVIVTELLDDGGDFGIPKNGWAWYTPVTVR